MRSEPPEGSRTGAGAVVAALEGLDVDLVFGQPGVHNLPIWTALSRSAIEVVGVRHEQTAAHAADGLARTTGRLGVAITTTGPGAVNTAGAVGEAFASRSSIVVIATDIASTIRRPGTYRGALHETRDQASIFASLTLATLEVSSADEIQATIEAAARTALAAPTGPVYVQIPTDLLGEPSHPDRFRRPTPISDQARSDGPDSNGIDDRIAEAAVRLSSAERPLIWAGGGAARSPGARPAVQYLAEQLQAPILETYMGRGLVSPDHPAHVGLPPHVPEAGLLWDRADAVVAIGSDLDGMTTQNWSMPSPPGLIAINVDHRDASKNYEPELVLEGDAADVTRRLSESLGGAPETLGGLREELTGLREGALARLRVEEPDAFELLGSVSTSWPSSAPIVCDMCIPGYWIAGFLPFSSPGRLVYPVGWGTLGFAFPAGIGAALGNSTERVLCVTGDGGFMFACGELATAKQEGAPMTILLVDDGGYGMLRFDFDAGDTEPTGVDLTVPDWEQLAASFDIPCQRADDLGESLTRVLRRHAKLEGPSMVIVEAALTPPPTTSPRWYRVQSESALQ